MKLIRRIAVTLAMIAAASGISGCVDSELAEHLAAEREFHQPTHSQPPRLTNWMENHYNHNTYGNRVCYREVVHNHGHTVIREINCQGRVLTETRRYNRH